MAFSDRVSLAIRDMSTNKISPLLVEYRSFDKFRNFGQALVHDDEGVVVEFFDSRCHLYHPDSVSLRHYHRPEYVYTLRMRNTWWIPTYAAALAICRSGTEPFHNADAELIYSKPQKLVIPHAQNHIVTEFHQLNHLTLTKNVVTGSISIDGIMSNKTHCALLTTFPVFDANAITEWFYQSMFLHYFQSKTRDNGPIPMFWKEFFKPHRKVMLYAGFRSQSLTPEQIGFCAGLNIRCLVRGAKHMHLV
eukprot:PhF_6_TR8073/c0_g1_i1/m.12494